MLEEAIWKKLEMVQRVELLSELINNNCEMRLTFVEFRFVGKVKFCQKSRSDVRSRATWNHLVNTCSSARARALSWVSDCLPFCFAVNVHFEIDLILKQKQFGGKNYSALCICSVFGPIHQRRCLNSDWFWNCVQIQTLCDISSMWNKRRCRE